MKALFTLLIVINWLATFAQIDQRDELFSEIVNAEKLPKLGQIELAIYKYSCSYIFKDDKKVELGSKHDNGICILNNEELFLFNIRVYFEVKAITIKRKRLVMHVVLIDNKKEIRDFVFRFRMKHGSWRLR